MKKIEMLNKELVNNEMEVEELDNVMVENGYYSILDDGVIEDIKRDKKAVYTGVKSGECEVVVNFEIVIDNGKDEVIDAFVMKVIGVEEF